MEISSVFSPLWQELIELDNVTINSHISKTFCISWSENNKISVIADGGVFIFVSYKQFSKNSFLIQSF